MVTACKRFRQRRVWPAPQCCGSRKGWKKAPAGSQLPFHPGTLALSTNARQSSRFAARHRSGGPFVKHPASQRRPQSHARLHPAGERRCCPVAPEIKAAQSAALPSSALSKACQYALALWKKLTRFLEYPELELSTNLAENSMRPVALGRKNWLHIGSPQAGPKVAAILSVVESCRRLQVPVRDYFSTILPGLADLPIRCLPDLTPAVWVARHS